MNFKQFLETTTNLMSEDDIKKVLLAEFFSPLAVLDKEKLFESTLPFIYAEDDPALGIKAELLIGNKDSLHEEIIEQLKDIDVDAGILDDFEEYTKTSPKIVKSRLFDAIHNDSRLITKIGEMLKVYGAVGRIGYSIDKGFLKTAAVALRKTFDVIPDINVLTFYANSITTPEMVKECVAKLKASEKIRPNTYIIFGNQIERIDAMETLQPATKEENENAKLQIAYHTGSWSDGRRVTPEEKRQLAEKLGIIKTTPPKTTWGHISSELTKKHGPHSMFTASENTKN